MQECKTGRPRCHAIKEAVADTMLSLYEPCTLLFCMQHF